MALSRIILAIAILCVSFAARAERRVALVIGNSAYETVSALANPVRDAKAVAAALREAGFAEVTEGYDLTKPKFDAALKSFGDSAAGADWALVYYAGHGIGIGGETYVLPVDAVLKRAEHADDEAVSLSRLRSKASGAKALRMVILDSCRSNPFAARLAREAGAKRAISRGLPAPAVLEGDELIAYATRENDVADDGEGAAHSPFTAAFLQHLREPGLEVRFLFGKVRDSVQAATARAQTPTTYGDLGGAYFYFRLPQAKADAPASLPPLSEAAEAWRVVEHSDSEAVLEAFVKRFVGTVFGDFARARLDEIRRAKIALKPVRDAPKAAPPPIRYIDKAQRLVRNFTGHSDNVHSVAFSPNGRTLASGGSDRTLKLWDAGSGQVLRTIAAHSKRITRVAFSPDGRTLASASEDHTVKLWDAATGQELHTLAGHTSVVGEFVFSPDGLMLASASFDKTFKFWDTGSGRELRTFSGHAGMVWGIDFSPDGRSLATSSDDNTIKVWDVATGQELRTLAGHKEPVPRVIFSPDGRTLASTSWDWTVKLWAVANGQESRTLAGFTHYIGEVAFSPDGKHLLSGSCTKTDANNNCLNGSLKLWSAVNGVELREFVGHSNFVASVAFSPDGRFALSGSYDKTLKLWDVSEWTQPQEARR